MTPNTPKPTETTADDERARRQEQEQVVREREAIRSSYLTILKEELDRLDRVIEGRPSK
jgi:hypothetical protein